MFRTIRSRITLVATALVAVGLVLASLLILRMVESDLLAATERALAAELELEAEGFIIDESDPFFDLTTNDRLLGLTLFVADDEAGIAIGSIIDPTTGESIADVIFGLDEEQVIDLLDPATGLPIEDDELEAYVEELAFDFEEIEGDEENTLLVGAVARDEVDESLKAVRDALLLIVPALVIAVGALIWWMVGRALNPVQAMSEQVQAISTTNLDERVAVPHSNDEIAGLATVMNGMLGRLQAGDQRQRQFAADASHELRSPLSTVRAAAEMIERKPDGERTAGLATDIVAEADRMDSLIGDLLALSRSDEAVTPEPHAPVDISQVALRFSHAVNVQPDIVVSGNETELERAIQNLVTNAIRHAHSTVQLAVRSVTHHDRRYAELTVEDDGAGVPAEQRSEIFERFRRLDEARSRDRGGAGLGLALVRAIAARHGGSIAVDDSPTLGGARFTLHIPQS